MRRFIPDYADSILRAEQHLRNCHVQIIDKKNIEEAAVQARSAANAVNSLLLDLELRLAGVRR